MASTKASGRIVYTEMPTGKGIHWHIPAMMVGAILAGGFFAICHHLFYQSLNGQPVSDAKFLSFPVSEQQANIAIGTAFAFLVKACLLFAIGVAFIQVFWSVSHTFSTTKTPTLGRLDSTYGARQNLWTVLNLALWWEYPLLLAVASTAWLVPIASIITPSTLSIRSAAIVPPPTSRVNVPNIDFRSMNFVALMEEDTLDTAYIYKGPSPAVSGVTSAVMVLGEILPFKAPDQNASWELEFPEPSLKCDHVLGKPYEAIRENIHDAEGYGETYYASWFQGKGGNQSNLLPFSSAPHSRTNFTRGSLVPSDNVDLTFHIAAMPIIGRYGWNLSLEEINKTRAEIRNFTLVQCRLVNSTYKTSFSFKNGSPNISTRITYIDAAQTLQSIKSSRTNASFVAFKDHCQASSRTCIFHRDFFQTLSYQAVMDAFSEQISGLVSFNSVTSNILSTALVDTSDLVRLAPGRMKTSAAWMLSLQWTLTVIYDRPEFRGLMNRAGPTLALDLPKAVEQLFQNVTVSLMTSATLQPNNASLTAPGPVNVTFHKYRNVYIYSALKLWIPYCISIGLTVTAALIGVCTMIDTDATYHDSFSTVIRAGKGAKLSSAIRDEDLDGRYPLPNYLKSTRIWLPGFIKTSKLPPFARYKNTTSPDIPLDECFPSNRAAIDSRLLEPYRTDGNRSIDHNGSSQFKRAAHSSYPDGLTDHI